jgi:serine/threonine protein kinase
MGVVYRARDERLERFVALKILPPHSTDNPDRKWRFVQEAKAASSLNHPNIITVHDIGTADGVSYIAMECVNGPTLHEVIGTSGLSTERLVDIGAQIADALDAAHRAGLLHRDLKPGNIVLADGRLVKVLDFGLAKLMGPVLVAAESDLTQRRVFHQAETQHGVIVGSPAYMSPEQIEARPLTAASDIFSFGCILYEMATGRSPFGAETTISTIAAVLNKTPTPIRKLRPDLPDALEEAVSACLNKDATKRPLLSDVKRVLDGFRAATQTRGIPRSFARGVSRRRRLRVLSAFFIAASILSVGGWRWWTSRSSEPLKVLRRLTTDAGLTAFPALSSDGKLLAYASDRGGDGALNLWIRQVSGGEAIRLTRGAADDREPSFSPDGSRLVFRSDRNRGGIYVMSALGGEPRQLAAYGRRPRFSPDGRWIAFWSGTSSNSGTFEKIYLIPAEGGEPKPWHAEFSSARDPVWSPDGRFLLFLGKRDQAARWPESADWWIAPVDGGTPRSTGAFDVLGRESFIDFVAPEAWVAPNDIVFNRRVGDSTNVWRVPLSRRQTILSPPQRLTFGAGLELQPAVAPTGAVVFASYTERLNLWGLPIDPGSGVVGDDLNRYTQGDALDGAPSISSDGGRSAFVSNKEGSDEIWVHDFRTGRDTRLTGAAGRKGLAVISPDGSHVAFDVFENGKVALYTAAANGGLVDKVCDSCGQPRSWTADLKHLVYQADDPSRFFVLDLVSKQSTLNLSDPERGVFSGNISRDGAWIAFHAKRNAAEGQQIFVAPFRTAGVRPEAWIPITSGEFEDDKPRWSADGFSIYFTSVRDGFRCLWVAYVDPATKRPLGDAAVVRHFHQTRLSMMYPTLRRFDLAVARDKIVFSLVERTANLWTAMPEAAAK